MSVLSDVSKGLADVVAQAGPGVVRVEARRRLPASGIVWSKEGIILTARHIIRREENIRIGLADGQVVSATLIGLDPTTDTAVLRAETVSLTPFTEANKQELGVGRLALALGRPGRSVQATLGILSAVGDSWRTRLGGQIDRYVQTDLVMYPGFSGGPLVDVNGRLLGMNTSGLGRGVSLAVPTSTLSRVADSLLAHGHMRRGYLGVSTQRVNLPQSLVDELGQKSGLLIVSVEPDSPAGQSGLMLGDTIVGIGDTTVQHHDALLAELSGDRIGAVVPIKIARGGKVQTNEVTIGERP